MRYDPHVVSGAIQIQSRNHDDDGRHGDGDAGVSDPAFGEGSQKSGRQGACKGCDRWWTGCQIHKLQPEGVGDGTDDACQGCQLIRTVEHDRESEYAAEACCQTKQEHRSAGEAKGQKIRWLQVKNKRHAPGHQRWTDNDDQRVGETFQSRTHIQFRQVDAACNERKSGNNKQHGADISRLMCG